VGSSKLSLEAIEELLVPNAGNAIPDRILILMNRIYQLGLLYITVNKDVGILHLANTAVSFLVLY